MMFVLVPLQVVTLVYGIYFLLLILGYLLVSSPQVSVKWGIMVEMFSLAPVAFVVAVYFPSFAGFFAFLRENTVARLTLTIVTFLVLLSMFSRKNGPEGLLMALAASAVGSVFIFMLAASGGIALAFIMLHALVVALVHERAIHNRMRYVDRGLRRAIRCLKELEGVVESCVGRSGFTSGIVDQMRYCAAMLEELPEATARGVAKELRREARKVEERGVEPDLPGRISVWIDELEKLLWEGDEARE
ncbi:MAG: hypothetical protein QXT93_08290 [Thermofilum sp.]